MGERCLNIELGSIPNTEWISRNLQLRSKVGSADETLPRKTIRDRGR